MAFQRIEPNKSLALSRVNSLLGKVFSIAATLVGAQTLSNAMSQFQRHNLNPFWFWLSLGLIAFAHFLIIFFVWFYGDGRIGFAALTLATVFGLVTWTLQLGDKSLPAGEQPWIWWSVGIAALSAVGGFGVFFATFFIVVLPIMWFLLQVSESGSTVNPLLALQDASFAFLFSAVLAGFVYILRYESAKVDAANQESNEASIALARADAIYRERDRIDALVHDSVLTTLLVAANATDRQGETEAELLAVSAIQRLIEAHLLASSDETISVSSLFGALEVAAKRQGVAIEVLAEGASDSLVPADVAAALTESALQALTNAVQHAGNGAAIQVYLKGTAKGVKIIVKDNGRGFRPARVPKNRLGLRLSIVGRMHSVGGRAFIDSKIGVGTNVIIEWNAE
jgi:signal transduction histidine kinase